MWPQRGSTWSRRDLVRIVEPGPVELWVGASSADVRGVVVLDLVGSSRQVGHDRVLEPEVTLTSR